jgi:hypothetical protein
MASFTDDPIDIEDSLACKPGGNQMVKKKKRYAYLSWNELMESIVLSLMGKKRR